MPSAICRFKSPPAGPAEIVDQRLRGNSSDRHDTAAAEWSDKAKLQFLIRVGSGGQRERKCAHKDGKAKTVHRFSYFDFMTQTPFHSSPGGLGLSFSQRSI